MKAEMKLNSQWLCEVLLFLLESLELLCLQLVQADPATETTPIYKPTTLALTNTEEYIVLDVPVNSTATVSLM